MNYKIFFFLLSGIILLQACKKDKPGKPDNAKYYLTAMTASTGKYVYNYNGQNRLISKSFYDATTPTQVSYTEVYSDFNSAGDPTKIAIVDHGETSAGVAEYDAQNRIAKITYRDASSRIIRISRFSYSSNKIEETANQDPTEASPPWKWICQINTRGNVEVFETYNPEGVLTQRNNYSSYDDKKSVYEFYNPLMGVSLYVNNPTAMESTQPPTGLKYQFTYTYEYNEGGYVTKRIQKNVTLGSESATSYEYVKK